MKKIKFITTVSTLGVLVAASPIVVTSCTTKGPGNYIVVKNTVYKLEDELTQEDIDGMVPQETKHVDSQTITLPISGQKILADVLTSVDYIIQIGDETFNAKEITEIQINSVIDPTSPGKTVRLTIPTGFLGGCTNLKRLDLSGLSVYSIGDWFLQPITESDMTIMCGKEVVDSFISGEAFKEENIDNSYELFMTNMYGKYKDFNGSLEEIILPTLVDVPAGKDPSEYTIVPNFFLAGQKKLKQVDLSTIAVIMSESMKQIPAGFLLDCSSLKSLDLSNILVNTINGGFLSGCSNLETIVLPTLTENATIITQDNENFTNPILGFMNGCTKITDIDFSNFAKLKMIPNNFFGAEMPEDYLVFKAIPEFGNNAEHFFTSHKMNAINLSPLNNVTSIGNNFLCQCISAKNILLPKSSVLETIGDNFLMNCKKLESIDLSVIPSVKSIGAFAFESCESLTDLDLSTFTSIEQQGFGPAFLWNCNSLTRVNIGDLSADKFIADDDTLQLHSFALETRVVGYEGIKIIIANEESGTNRNDLEAKFAENWSGPSPQPYWIHWRP